jgi:hypothetical protein
LWYVVGGVALYARKYWATRWPFSSIKVLTFATKPTVRTNLTRVIGEKLVLAQAGLVEVLAALPVTRSQAR